MQTIISLAGYFQTIVILDSFGRRQRALEEYLENGVWGQPIDIRSPLSSLSSALCDLPPKDRLNGDWQANGSCGFKAWQIDGRVEQALNSLEEAFLARSAIERAKNTRGPLLKAPMVFSGVRSQEEVIAFIKSFGSTNVLIVDLFSYGSTRAPRLGLPEALRNANFLAVLERSEAIEFDFSRTEVISCDLYSEEIRKFGHSFWYAVQNSCVK